MNEFSFELIRDVAPQPIVLEPLHTEENGVFAPPAGVNGFSSVEVAVPIPPAPVLTTLSVSENGTYTPEQGVDGFSEVEVDVDNRIRIEADAKYALANIEFWQQNHNRIDIGELTNMTRMFYENVAIRSEDLPSVFYYHNENGLLNLSEAFYNTFITSYPEIRSADNVPLIVHTGIGIENCYWLERLDETFWNNINVSNTYQLDPINNCYRLRNIPQNIISNSNYSTALTYGGIGFLYSMDEIIGYPIMYVKSNFMMYASHLKRFKYTYNGAEYNCGKNATVYFNNYIGYAQNAGSYMTNTNITAATQITDAASYAALKNNPDAWTADIAYSRYNRASAAETLTSLPTNTNATAATIKFEGAAGSATDEGAINTMTAEEIAVATTKNFTVAYV